MTHRRSTHPRYTDPTHREVDREPTDQEIANLAARNPNFAAELRHIANIERNATKEPF